MVALEPTDLGKAVGEVIAVDFEFHCAAKRDVGLEANKG
jgi:hypothetical protein